MPSATPIWIPDARLPRRSVASALLGLIAVAGGNLTANAQEDEPADRASNTPAIYLDMSTVYARTPGSTLSFGLARFSTQPGESVTLNAPLTIDFSNGVSIYGGISAITSSASGSSWSSLALSGWNVGFSADVIAQHDYVPALNIQSTLSRTIGTNTLGQATSSSTIAEFTYAYGEDEANGLLGGVRTTLVFPDSRFISVRPSVTGYVGAYQQWESNWKVTGRAGVQVFGGADLGSTIQLASFAKPIFQLDLDKMDDDDNRLFGVSAELAWVPKLSFQLTLRLPIYLAPPIR